MTAIDGDSSDRSGQNELKTFWKGFTLLDAIKNILDSWKEAKISALSGLQKKLIPTLMDLRLQWKKLTADVVEITTELEFIRSGA